MAVTMSNNSILTTLATIFGVDSQVYKKAAYLKVHGAKLQSGLTSFKITMPDGKEFVTGLKNQLLSYNEYSLVAQTIIAENVSQVIEMALMYMGGQEGQATDIPTAPDDGTAVDEPHFPQSEVNVPAWMKTVAPSLKEQKAVKGAMQAHKNAMQEHIEESLQSIAEKAAIKVSHDQVTQVFVVPTESNPENTGINKEMFGAVLGAMSKASKPKQKPTPIAAVVKLKEAKALSQKVQGTSAGSVYRVAAVGKVNVAVREADGNLSVRAEFPDGEDKVIADNLESMGFTKGKTHMSIHVQLTAGTPAIRVIGSILLGISTPFDEIATTAEQIHHD